MLIMKPVDVLIHIRPHLDAGSHHLLDEAIRKIPGVIAPWFTPHKSSVSFVIIYYNPKKVSATKLLVRVRRLGFNASLIAI